MALHLIVVVVLHPFITGQVQRFGNATIDK